MHVIGERIHFERYLQAPPRRLEIAQVDQSNGVVIMLFGRLGLRRGSGQAALADPRMRRGAEVNLEAWSAPGLLKPGHRVPVIPLVQEPDGALKSLHLD